MNGEEIPKPIILVVDDAPENLALLAGLLKDQYRVKVANNGKKALQIVSGATPPDMVLLDVLMPEMDGYEVCRQIRAQESLLHIPVVFLSGLEEQSVSYREHGANGFLTKPIEPEALHQILHTLLPTTHVLR